MEKRPYQYPQIFVLGSVKELTHSTPEPDKCSGSGEVIRGHSLSFNFNGDCP